MISSVSAPHVCERIAYLEISSPMRSLVRLSWPAFLYCRRRIIKPDFREFQEKWFAVDVCRRVGMYMKLFVELGWRLNPGCAYVDLAERLSRGSGANRSASLRVRKLADGQLLEEVMAAYVDYSTCIND